MVNSQKLDNQLNLALDAEKEDRAKSDNLNVGYDNNTRTWQLIVRYTANLDRIKQLGVEVQELLGGYAILTVPENLIDIIAASKEILYVEKPKRLNFAVENGKRVSCINGVQRAPYGLRGTGCIVSIIDSGIDYTGNVFLNENGETRILELWDQTIEGGTPPQGYTIGALYGRENINAALKATADERYNIVPSRDISGHGTSVASVAVGNFAEKITSNADIDIGIATRADIIVVKLGNPASDSFPRTSELMLAIDFCVRRAIEYGRPMAINLSFGNNYGSHDGTSLLATYINTVAAMGRISISVGAGNEGASGSHVGGMLDKGEVRQIQEVELVVGRFETSFNIQLWKSYADSFNIEIEAPNGDSTGNLVASLGAYNYRLGDTMLFIYYGEPAPYSPYQEIFMEFIPKNLYIDEGVWRIRMIPVRIVDGRYDMWLPATRTSIDTRFLQPSPEVTLTIPSTASNVITVGAYDGYSFAYADFSGRGYTRATNMIKPDIVAPGVNIRCAAPGNEIVERTGTSFATPFVSGSTALMMEWGIVRGNDPYLYGEKVKAYLIRGARQLPGYEQYPNPQLGWGALCLDDSIPKL